MADLDITLRRKNGANYDKLNPTTTWGQVEDKPTTFTPTAHTHVVGDLSATGTPSSTTFLRGDGTWATPAGVDNYVNITGDTMTGALNANAGINLNNSDITNVNQLTFNDPGPNEGLIWNQGNLWKFYESPNDLSTNGGGNLQIVQNTTRRATFNTSGQLELPVTNGTAPLLISSTTAVSNLNADLLDGNHASDMMEYQSLSEFASGTLVRTSINASISTGDSFVIEIVGKSYSTSAPPFKYIAQGYLYNGSIINYSGLDIGANLGTVKIFEDSGNLCFWWARISYWNSFKVRVYRASGADSTPENTVTAITDSTEPTGTKKVTLNAYQVFSTYHLPTTSEVSGLQTALDLKANLASPTLTGTPTAPTATAGTNTTQLATTAFVRTEVANLIASAPGTLDTLDELASALGDDPNFATTVTNSIAGKVSKSGDTMTGDLTISKLSPQIILSDTDGGTTTYPAIQFDTANNQGVRLYHTEFDSELPVAGYGLVLGASPNNNQFPGTATLSLAVLGEIYAGSTTLNSTQRVFHDGYHPNADTLTTARTLTIGSTGKTFNGSANVSWSLGEIGAAATSHTHAISDVTNLQTSLDAKAALASPALTGTPTAPTATAGTNTTQLATTAFVTSAVSTKQDSATALTTSTSFGGDVSGTYNAIVVADDSHNHIISNVDGLQTALDGKASTSHTHAISDVTNLQTSLDAKAADADVVKLTGAQSIAGVKTFTSRPLADSGLDVGLNTGTTSDSITFNTAQTFTGPYLRGQVQDLYRGYYTSSYKIWDEGNDGTGSGLDADLLDGNHASAFALSSHTHAATDITSGTIATARLGSGTADTTTFLRGDNTWSTAGIATYSTATLYVKRIWSRPPGSSQVWTSRYDNTTGAGTTISTTSTWTTIALGYTPGSTDQFMIEFSNSSSNSHEKGICIVGNGTFSSTAGMSVLSYDAYETVDGTQLKIAKYYMQWYITGTSIGFRYGSKMVW